MWVSDRIGRDIAPNAVAPVGDTVPWAQPYDPGKPPSSTAFDRPIVPAGTYTLEGKVRGSAQVTITNSTNSSGVVTGVASVAVTYTNYSDDGDHIINGSESVQNVVGRPGQTPTQSIIDWTSNLIETGTVSGTKVTTGDPSNTFFPNGFELSIDLLTNDFVATGTLTTTINGVTYTQPANHQ
jgi:hypothetical protein